MTGGGGSSTKPSSSGAGGAAAAAAAPDAAAATGFLTPEQRAALDAALASKKKGAPASDDGGGLFLRPRGSGGGGSGAPASKPKPAPQRRAGGGGGGGGGGGLEGGGGGGGGRRSSLDNSSSGPPRHHERSHSGRHGAGNRPGRPKKGGAGGKWTWLGRDDDDLDDFAFHPNSHGGHGHGHGNASGSLGSHGSYNRNGGGAGMRLAARYLDERDPNFSDSEEMAMPPPLSSSSLGGGGGGGSRGGGGGGRTPYALHTDLESRLREYKQGLRSLIDEYFDSGDVAEAAASLAELGAPAFDHHFVKRLVGAALDRGAREREAASVLLSALSGAAVPVAALERGFWDLAQAADDLELDVPGASSLIGTFLARAVVDDALPPSFVSTLPSGAPSPTRAASNSNAAAGSPPSSSSNNANPLPPATTPPVTGAAAVRAAAEAALHRPHAAEALSGDACWGDAGATHAGGYAATRAAVAHILSDFLSSSECCSLSSAAAAAPASSDPSASSAAAAACAAASQRFSALRSPFCGHELVKQAVLAVADAADEAVNGPNNKGAKEEARPPSTTAAEAAATPRDPAAVAAAVAALLASLADAGTVSSSQMAKGFERVEARLPQLGPEAAAAAEKLAEDAEKAGWLERNGEGIGIGNGAQASTTTSTSSPTASSRPAPFDADAPPPPHLAAAAAVPAGALARYKAGALAAWDEYFASGDVDALAAALLAAAASAARGANSSSSSAAAAAAVAMAAGGGGAAAAAAANGSSSAASVPPPLSSSPPPPVDPRAFSWAAVKVGVRLACDRRAAEREAASVALASLVGDATMAPPNSPLGVLSHEAAATGFLSLLDAAEDLALDVPAAPRLLSLFVARAVVDEVLPPSFLADAVPALRANSLGLAAVAAAGASLGARHAAERALGCWSVAGGALRADDRSSFGLKSAMQAAIDEFSLCGPGDAAAEAEVAACLRELDAPFYHHEFVKRALTAAATASAAAAAAAAARRSSEGGGAAADKNENDDDEKLTPAEARLLDLLARLTATGEVSQTQAARGAARFAASVDDLALDCPGARASAARLERGLAERGIVGK